MAIKDGWLDWATRIDGVPDKVYSAPNSGEWITCHSVVGFEGETDDGIPNRFLSTAKNPDGSYTADAAASCMFILRKSGKLIQMYPITASTWTSGGREANTRSWAVEAEGGQAPNFSEPLTPSARSTFVKLVREWEAHTGRRAIPNVTLRQHKDVAREFGYAPTACASDRYAAAWEDAARPIVAPAPAVEDMELRLAMADRLALWRLGADPDHLHVRMAVAALRGAGFRL